MHTAKATLSCYTSVAVSVSRPERIVKRGFLLSERISGGTVATVFGATGFLGRYVVNRFGRMGAPIAVPFRGNEKDVDHLKVMGDVGQIAPTRFDIRDPVSVAFAVSRSNTVVNCLGKHWATRNFSMQQANVDSARTIATACKEAGIQKFIHVSCVGASEDHPSEFMRTKWEAEQVVRSILPQATIVRVTQMFGAEDRLLNKFGYIGRFTPVFALPLRPDAYIQPVSVRDVATAIMEIVKEKHLEGKTYELGGPEIFELRDFIEDVIFENLKIDRGYIVPIPHQIARVVGWVCQQVRGPVYTADEVEWYERDNIVPDGALSWKELDLPQPQNIQKTAVNLLRMYRKPVRFNVA